ncbi:MAG: nicotinate (nicotinamide) nucleotide adenylyltransferase [Treponema sp.]|nr:nicotinate (nicotinamide) nucleotide adenylyltransferase [Treponema sp.]
MKLALLGGSFNPLHIGHAMLAETVVTELGYDTVLFVPAFIPPHKTFADAPSAQDRFNMTLSFCRNSAHFEATDCEIARGGVSYTFDTVQFIIDKFKGILTEKPALIMGQENAAEFDKWHRANELVHIANIIIARRSESERVIDTAAFENKPTGSYTGGFDKGELVFPHAHVLLENPLLPISSTDVRARIASGKSWRYLVPERVFQYIIKHKLYGYR